MKKIILLLLISFNSYSQRVFDTSFNRGKYKINVVVAFKSVLITVNDSNGICKYSEHFILSKTTTRKNAIDTIPFILNKYKL